MKNTKKRNNVNTKYFIASVNVSEIGISYMPLAVPMMKPRKTSIAPILPQSFFFLLIHNASLTNLYNMKITTAKNTPTITGFIAKIIPANAVNSIITMRISMNNLIILAKSSSKPI